MRFPVGAAREAFPARANCALGPYSTYKPSHIHLRGVWRGLGCVLGYQQSGAKLRTHRAGTAKRAAEFYLNIVRKYLTIVRPFNLQAIRPLPFGAVVGAAVLLHQRQEGEDPSDSSPPTGGRPPASLATAITPTLATAITASLATAITPRTHRPRVGRGGTRRRGWARFSSNRSVGRDVG